MLKCSTPHTRQDGDRCTAVALEPQPRAVSTGRQTVPPLLQTKSASAVSESTAARFLNDSTDFVHGAVVGTGCQQQDAALRCSFKRAVNTVPEKSAPAMCRAGCRQGRGTFAEQKTRPPHKPMSEQAASA